MLWWSGSVPDLGHLDLQTKKPELLLYFLCGFLNTAGQVCRSSPFPEGGDAIGRDVPGPRKTPWLGDGSLWLELCLWENRACTETLRFTWASSAPASRVGPWVKTLLKGEKAKSWACFGCVAPQQRSERVLKRLNQEQQYKVSASGHQATGNIRR